jgi:starch synthase
MTRLKVLSVASEIFPLIKTGGLADVTGALPLALAAEGVDMRTLVPGYPAVLGALEEAHELSTFPGLFGSARLIAGKARGLNLFVLDAPYLYDRPGNPYAAPDGTDWPDNAYRYGALAKVAAEIGLGLLPAFQPDVVHMHDWQAGLTAAYMHYSGKAAPGTVMTVHNLAFQGQFPAELVMPLGLPPASFAWDGVEHYGAIGFLKAGLQLADRITTVSPSYAMEIMQPETGMGFDGLLRVRADKVSGILNGIDTAVWDPANDPLIVKTYNAANLDARAANRLILRNVMGLSQEPGALVVGVVSRLSWQKGLDLLLEVLPALIAEGMQLALLGAGDAELEAQFLAAAESYPGKIGVKIGHDETLAHRIQAGADAVLMPSRFEPCGLTQLCALRYGAVPIVGRVGGLVDTVIDATEMGLASGAATGVQFSPVTSDSLAVALWRTAKLFRDRTAWQTMQKNGMGTDVSWHRPARRYASLYRELCSYTGEASASDSAKGKVASVEAPASDSGKDKVAAIGTAGSEGEKGKAASAGMVGLASENSIVSFAGRAGPESEKSKVASAATAIPQSVKAAVSLAATASLESEKGAVSFAGRVGPESEKSKVASAGTASPQSGKAAVSLAATASLESEKDGVSFAGRVGPESEKSKVASAGTAIPQSGKAVVSLAGAASPESEKGAVSFAGKAGSEAEKTKVADIEADESGDEADNVVSIACRDA